MIGILRFFLASCVILFHLSGLVPNIGQMAVNFFYVISGYLITLILHETYKFKFAPFAINRFLRLYPVYYVFALMSTFFIMVPISGVTSSIFHGSWANPLQQFDVFGNALIFPWAFLSDQAVGAIPGVLYSEIPRLRLIPSTWSIAVEIVCYFILFIFSARSALTALITIALSAAYHYYIHTSGMSSGYLYYPFMAAMLPFGVGALGCFMSRYLEKRHSIVLSMPAQVSVLTLVIVLFLTNWWLSVGSPDFYKSVYFYASTVIALFSIMALHNSTPTQPYKKICKLLGDLSYPMFLIQYIGGYIGWHLIGRPENVRGLDVFIAGYIASLVISLIAVYLLDHRVQRLRDKVRPG